MSYYIITIEYIEALKTLMIDYSLMYLTLMINLTLMML